MNYYLFYFRCIIKYSVSVICDYLFTVYSEICQILFTTRYFEQFKSDMCGCEWLKISGRYILTKNFIVFDYLDIYNDSKQV